LSLKSDIKVWAAQIRANFLVLSIVLVMIGTAIAYKDGYMHSLYFILVMIGVILSHISVNLFNEYSDYKTGIDFLTDRTPFSGGSGVLQKQLLDPKTVLNTAIGTLVIAFLIGLYLSYATDWRLTFFILTGAFASVYYTNYLARSLLGELFAGLCLGTLVVLGTYFVFAQSLSYSVIIVSIPPGILTALLLLLNEFPDEEADRFGGRRHLVIKFGKKKAAYIYSVGLVITYMLIIISVVVGGAPKTILISLLTVPLAVKSAYIAIRYGDNRERLIPALGMNVGIVIGTDFLLGIGYLL